jgi:uncharacterized membrane protein SpoIIM required for sporulation
VIIDLQSFIADERRVWSELEALLERIENDPAIRLTLDEIRRFHYLYQRASADLAKINTFAAERELNRYLEALVARAYGEIHQTRARPAVPFQPLQWFLTTLPRTFRRHVRAFWLSLAITLAGCAFGGLALTLDPGAKAVLMPFQHLAQSPAERVAREKQDKGQRLAGRKASFSAELMTHNIRVSVLTFALGMSYGLGTITMLFYNGVILGAVGADYIAGGQTQFLLGWLLPHGAVEIPAILLAGQAGLMLAGALIGWGRRLTLRRRLAELAPDLVTVVSGLALLLVWAGLVEAFLSQYHEPVIPYAAKILFGLAELALLVFYFARMGLARHPERRERA